MRLLDPDARRSVRSLQVYLTTTEAAELRDALDVLLRNAEAAEHRHVMGDGREMSFSILTPAKLADLSGYTELQRHVLQER